MLVGRVAGSIPFQFDDDKLASRIYGEDLEASMGLYEILGLGGNDGWFLTENTRFLAHPFLEVLAFT
ncbi:hypothetical protein [Halalkalicoccus salilacus]|uniref:hypothetical protein n=1 Tax=Halalkalicoccus sp. GCM10025704 TaxID=3252662 RepID=UPI00360F1C02